MQDHLQDLLQRFQYSEQLRETAVFRILFGGEDPSQVMADLDIHNSEGVSLGRTEAGRLFRLP